MATPVLRISSEESAHDLAQRVEQLKRDAARISGLLLSKLGEDSHAYIRSEQVEAAVQRLEWALDQAHQPASSL